ncbi:DUF58 domain-containing protein [Natronomonas sp.]|uniref:DUF58 domain-containing protein n=1 Tax=Natronomonas sp. TaxID=2184060 RepID=UPI003974ED57
MTDDAARLDGGPIVRSTGRWRGIVAVTLLAVAAGLIAKRPPLLLVGAVGIAFAAYPRLAAVPEPELSVTRRIAPDSPGVGDAVTVRTTIRNEGESTLFDLRVVDGVPAMLAVDDGSPRCATALRPGGETTVTYRVRARAGRHRFQPTTVLCRDASGAVELETAVTAEDTIECAARIPAVPLRARSSYRTGPLLTDDGGRGLEFHSVEEYRRGDPASRIDWRRYARTGELTSVTFRLERLADVIVCVDARPEAYRASVDSEPHAVAHAVDAAGRIGDALFDAPHRVGLAAFGRELCFLAPDTGRDHAIRFQRRLVSDPALDLSPPPQAVRAGADAVDSNGTPALDRQLSTIRSRLDSSTQLVLITPLCDDGAHRIAQRFELGGGVVTVVSPDATTDRTVGGRLARLERDHRLTALRNAGIPVADWEPTEPLGAALATLEGWRR